MKKTIETEKSFCDFCDAEIYDNDRPFSINAMCNNEVVFEYGHSKYDWDVCPDCAQKLVKVLYNRLDNYIPERYEFDNYKYRDKCKENVKKLMEEIENGY